jgi:acyl dehydratase
MPGFYDDPDIKKAAEGGEYTKFVDVGDTISGVIQKLAKRDFDGRTAIEVEMDGERKVTFGQVLMLRDLYVLQPVPGDTLTVTLAEVQKKGAKTLKMFKGEITRSNGEVEVFDQTS